LGGFSKKLFVFLFPKFCASAGESFLISLLDSPSFSAIKKSLNAFEEPAVCSALSWLSPYSLLNLNAWFF